MIKVKAKIYLYKHKGRKTSFGNGYRPAFSFDENNNQVFTGQIELINQDVFERGTLNEVYITFTSNSKSLKEGTTFSINEPPIEIGEGEIIEIVD